MPKWLTQEWHQEFHRLARSQPERPGASARMQYVVTGGPEGDVRYYWLLENGQLVDNGLGDIADPEVTLTMTYEDAMKIQQGELDANAAFMQGRIKVDDIAKLLPLLPITNSPEFKQLQEEVRAVTEY